MTLKVVLSSTRAIQLSAYGAVVHGCLRNLPPPNHQSILTEELTSTRRARWPARPLPGICSHA